MHELVVNLHMHTPYSDGHRTHAEIAQAAIKAGIDAVIVTDHNVWVDGPSGYYQDGDRKVLMLIGEEIHDQSRDPQKNHLLVFGVNREMATLAPNPQRLIDEVVQAGGLAFIAHPTDPAAPAFNEPDISWVDWHVKDYTGIELWNAMSEFKSLLKSKPHAIFYAFFPKRIARGPLKPTMQKWDELLANGQKVVAIGGSDAHALPGSLGPIKKTLFPYLFHFQCVNTHLLTSSPLTGDDHHDQSLILEALRNGHAFIGYDLPARTEGFRFSGSGEEVIAQMGDDITIQTGVTFQIRLPKRTECHLLKDGKIIKSWFKREHCTYITTEPGVYRVEVYKSYLGGRRGWIFSNPIYVRELS
jgi:hypothetical protein